MAGEQGGHEHTGSTLWHGRFAGGPDAALMAYTVSLPFDRRLWRDDIAGSRAHVRGLARVGLLTRGECDSVLVALDRVELEMAEGTFDFVEADEDIHTAVERRVTELAGPAGAKLHTARSRNDQVATDLRLWCKRELVEVARGLYDLQHVLFTRAIEAGDVYLPGYTHLQRAQPVLLSHHLMAHGWAFARDIDRLLATVDRLDVSPLGAGALAGTSLSIDPAGTAADLGFARAFDNSLDAVSDRDFVAEALFDLALVGVHLSRIGEEWVLWTSEEFGFAVLDDAVLANYGVTIDRERQDDTPLLRLQLSFRYLTESSVIEAADFHRREVPLLGLPPGDVVEGSDDAGPTIELDFGDFRSHPDPDIWWIHESVKVRSTDQGTEVWVFHTTLVRGDGPTGGGPLDRLEQAGVGLEGFEPVGVELRASAFDPRRTPLEPRIDAATTLGSAELLDADEIVERYRGAADQSGVWTLDEVTEEGYLILRGTNGETVRSLVLGRSSATGSHLRVTYF